MKATTNEQEVIAATIDLEEITDRALRGYIGSRDYLKKIWPECDWKTIKERLQTEGSDWIVWWMDGVAQHLINIRKQTR